MARTREGTPAGNAAASELDARGGHKLRLLEDPGAVRVHGGRSVRDPRLSHPERIAPSTGARDHDDVGWQSGSASTGQLVPRRTPRNHDKPG